VADVLATPVAVANRIRDTNVLSRAVYETRQANERQGQNRADDLSRRKADIQTDAQRAVQTIDDRRTDAATEQARQQSQDRQRLSGDTIVADARAQQARDDLATARRRSSEDAAAVQAQIDRQQQQAQDIAASNGGHSAQTAQTDIQTFLREREQRLADRQTLERNLQAQQRLDLRNSIDNAANATSSANLPRGSIIDVSG